LYVPHADALSYMKVRNLAVTLNLHDADGVNAWETQYANMCATVGQDPTQGKAINFTIVNSTIAYALEDVVLRPLEEDGVDFWWIDWQQGETGKGGAAGGKQNPTILTAHVRSTDANRRGETNRNMVLARWGGLGAHRYPVHFSGDAAISWNQLSFQPYFSMVRYQLDECICGSLVRDLLLVSRRRRMLEPFGLMILQAKLRIQNLSLVGYSGPCTQELCERMTRAPLLEVAPRMTPRLAASPSRGKYTHPIMPKRIMRPCEAEGRSFLIFTQQRNMHTIMDVGS
jgi:hypothetical protein